MRVLIITSEWPSLKMPSAGIFIVRQVDFLQRAGVNVNVFHFRGAKNPLKYIRAWYHVQRLLMSECYDLIHAHWGQAAFPALPKRLPLVVTFHGSDLFGIKNSRGQFLLSGKILSLFSRWVAMIADQIILVSSQMDTALPKRHFHIIPSGIDLSLFRPITRVRARFGLGLAMDRKIIFFGGSPSNLEKRYPLALAALNLLKKDFPTIDIIVAHGIEHDKMPYYINACDVLLLTSMHEGSPNVVKEALACNIPIVSTDVGDVRQRIGNIEGCILCANDRPETIALALKKVLERNKKIEGRECVRDLDESLLTQEIIQVYEKAVSKL
jgi:teichuronic acid biosynthesis glycosyltransferase TuaC